MRVLPDRRLLVVLALVLATQGCQGSVRPIQGHDARPSVSDGPAPPPLPKNDATAPPTAKDAMAPDLKLGGGDCTDQEALLDGHCYRALGVGEMTYQSARELCESLGAKPISIQGEAENQLAFDLLYMWTSCAWIGMTRQGGDLAWEDGSPMTFENWQPGEPGSSDCVCLRGPDASESTRGQWRDYRCSSLLREIICERVP